MLNLDEVREAVYRLALLKLDEEDASDLTEAIIDAIEENLEEVSDNLC